MSSRRAWVLIAVATTASCQLVYGLDDFQAGTTSGSSSSAGGTDTGSGAGSGAGGGSTGGGGPVGGAPSCGATSDAACVSSQIAAYVGFYHLVETDPAHEPTACASQATPKHFFEQPPADGACTACTCDLPGTSCSIPALYGYLTSCIPPKAQVSDGMGCDLPLGVSVKYAAPKPNDCTPHGGELVTAGWGHEVTLCEIVTGTEGCGRDEICAPSDQPLCVVATGALGDCPAGWGTPRVVYATQTDDRKCSMCSCAPQWGCPGIYRIFDGSGGGACSGNETDLQPGDCIDATAAQYDDRPPSGTVDCTPSGGQPNGDTFKPQAPYTICCVTPH